MSDAELARVEREHANRPGFLCPVCRSTQPCDTIKLVAALRGARRENAELTHRLVSDMGNAAEVERKRTEAAEQRAEAAHASLLRLYCTFGEGVDANATTAPHELELAIIAGVEQRLADYELLKRAVNEDSDCLPACNEYEHAEDCPRVNTATLLENKQKRIEAAERERDEFRDAVFPQLRRAEAAEQRLHDLIQHHNHVVESRDAAEVERDALRERVEKAEKIINAAQRWHNWTAAEQELAALRERCEKAEAVVEAAREALHEYDSHGGKDTHKECPACVCHLPRDMDRLGDMLKKYDAAREGGK